MVTPLTASWHDVGVKSLGSRNNTGSFRAPEVTFSIENRAASPAQLEARRRFFGRLVARALSLEDGNKQETIGAATDRKGGIVEAKEEGVSEGQEKMSAKGKKRGGRRASALPPAILIAPFLVASSLGDENKSVLLKYLDNLIGFQPWQLLSHQTGTSTSKTFSSGLNFNGAGSR